MFKFKKEKHEQSKYFTLMLVPYSSSKTKSIRIKHSVFYSLIGALTLVIVLISGSYFYGKYYKNEAQNKQDELELELEKNWELMIKNNVTKEDIEKQKKIYKEQQVQFKKQIDNYKSDLDSYEIKAQELENKIEELDKQKDALYNLLSEKVGEDLVASNKKIQVEMASLGIVFANDTDKKHLSPIELNKTYVELEELVNSKINEFTDLEDKINYYKPYLDSMPNIWPVYGRVTSRFGNRGNPFGGSGREFHNALDISVPTGTSVTVTGKGVVTFAGWQNGYGYVVEVDHGYSLKTLYAHNSKLLVSVGQSVNRGDSIALSGSTGRSTGPHVHYEVLKDGASVNPENYIE